MTRSSISFQYHHGRSRYQFVYNEHMAANNRKDVNYPRMQRAAIRKVVHGTADSKDMHEAAYLSARPRGYKTFFMLNSIEHETLNAHKYKNVKKFCIF